MKRRNLLALSGVGSTALAGCTTLSLFGERCYDKIKYNLKSVGDIIDRVAATELLWLPDKNLPPNPNLIHSLINGETRTVEIAHTLPIKTLPYIRKDGKIYKFSMSVTDWGKFTAPEYSVNRTSSSVGVSTHLFSDLPEHDQWRFYEALASRNNNCFVGYLDSEKNRKSILAREERRRTIDFKGYDEFINHSRYGRYYEVRLNGDEYHTVESTQFSADFVAENESSFDNHYLNHYENAFHSDNFDSDVKRLLEKATNGEVSICVAGDGDDDLKKASEKFENILGDRTNVKRSTDSVSQRKLPIYIKHNGKWYHLERERQAVQ